MVPSKTNKWKIYSELCGRLPITPNKENEFIYIMYVYDCNAILKNVMKNRSDKEMIQDFTELTTDLNIRIINP